MVWKICFVHLLALDNHIQETPVTVSDAVEAVQLVEDGEGGSCRGKLRMLEETALRWEEVKPCFVASNVWSFGKETVVCEDLGSGFDCSLSIDCPTQVYALV